MFHINLGIEDKLVATDGYRIVVTDEASSGVREYGFLDSLPLLRGENDHSEAVLEDFFCQMDAAQAILHKESSF